MSNQESFSLKDAARLLGVSRWTVMRAIRKGRLASFRVEGCRRVHLSELRRYKRDAMVATERL